MLNEAITQEVSKRYAKAVTTGEEMCCPTGYNHKDLQTFIPEAVLKVSYGCGTPVGLTTVQAGETVLDIGSGGGIDCFEASRRVGPIGQVIGIDMTDEMLDFARAQAPVVAANLGYTQSNVEFRKGQADAIPVTDNSVDLIVSNCVINLAPDKPQVFREMYRVLRPGSRFTISDIVADQSIPNYLLHDKEKWGDCLSGSLQLGTYWKGIREAGFRGIHQVSFIPWKIIDGIHFLSLTLTGYKLPEEPMLSNCHYATFTGPFSRVVDEQGQGYHRGIPEKIDAGTATLLQSPPYRDSFVMADTPVELSNMDPRLTSVAPEEIPCLWEGHFALLTGPFLKVTDDDHHEFPCGEPLEVCSKTLKVLRSEPYNSHFVVINRSGEAVSSPETISADTCC